MQIILSGLLYGKNKEKITCLLTVEYIQRGLKRTNQNHNVNLYVSLKQHKFEAFGPWMGVVGGCEGVVYLMSPGRPTDIGLQLDRACYPCSR